MGSTPLILLDTHIWVWFHVDPVRIPVNLRQAMGNPETRLGISVVSIWETIVAMEKGRIRTIANPEYVIRSWLAENPFEIIPLEKEMVFLSRTLAFTHNDPADRFIAATAFRLNCRLATVDSNLISLPWLSIFEKE